MANPDYRWNVFQGGFQTGSFPAEPGAPADCDLHIYRGDSFSETFQLVDGTSGLPIALNGTWTAMLRQDPDASTLLATFTVDQSQGASGKVTVSLDSPTTTAIPEDIPMGWDLQETDTNGTVTTWLVGTVSFTLDYTH